MWRARGSLAFTLIGALVLGTGTAAAQGDKSAAVALYDQAEALAHQGRYAEACEKYEESNRLDPQLGVLLHLAECREKLGQYASAWASFRDAADLADRRADARSLAARERANALESKLSRLTIVVPEAAVVDGLSVLRDGVAVRAPLWGVPVPVDPGEHVVVVTAPGKVGWRGTASVKGASSAASITVPVLADAPVANASARSVADAGAEGGSAQRVLGWAGVGVGAAAVAAGVVFHVRSASKVSERDDLCPQDICATVAEKARVEKLTDEARSSATIGTAALVAGGVLAGGGVALILTAPKRGSQERATLTPLLAPGFGGLSLRSTW